MLNSPYVKALAPAAIVGVGTHVVLDNKTYTVVAFILAYGISVYAMTPIV